MGEQVGERAAGVGGRVARGLWFGSHEPHGVYGEGPDRAPVPRARSLSMAAHVRASADELMAREFPSANVAPATAVRAPPPPPPCDPPRVTHREQVAPAASWRLVARWQRQMRRCFRAAARGNASLARRLRPADLWLAHEDHSCPATAPWDWDLRPLAWGGDAVPLPVSGRDGLQPQSSLALDEIATAAAAGSFPDQAILSEAMQGICDDSRCARGTLLCAPHVGALRELAVAVGKAEGDVTAGWASGGHRDLPCWPLRSCPYSVVDESERAGRPKFRLTIDLSWPHAGMMAGVDSVNGAMDRSRWPECPLVRVSEYAEAADILRGGEDVARRPRLWSMDCSAYYRAVGRQTSELWRNAIFLPGGVRLDERCCFGDASAATKCARLSNFLAHETRRALDEFDAAHPTQDPSWVAWQQSRAALGLSRRLFWCALYIDDEMGTSADDLLFDASGAPVLDAEGVQQRRAAAHFAVARAVLARYGWSSESSKEQPPAEAVEALGMLVELADAGRLSLTRAKRERYAAAASAAAASTSLSPGAVLRLVGRLQFAAQCYPVGRQQLHSTWRMARVSSRRRDGCVPVSPGAREELLWWATELRRPCHEGVPLARCGARSLEEGASAVYADASDDGFAAWTLSPEGEVLLMGGLWSAAERALTIADRELLASTWGLVGFAACLPAHVVSFTDNTVCEGAMRTLAPRGGVAQLITARRTAWLHATGRMEYSRRITTHANLWADIGSRPEYGGVSEVARQAAMLGLRSRVLPVPWRDTTALLSPESTRW